MLPRRADEGSTVRRLASAYLDAKAEVIRRGYASEVDWQYDTCLRRLDERLFMRESAWVILSAGLSERVVRSRFALVSDAFAGFENAGEIWRRRRVRRAHALAAFHFAPKIDAILTIVGYLARVGFDHVRNRLEHGAVEFLLQFPYLGPATARHLAKNLGLQVAKPDRHLVRLASRLGHPNVSELCGAVSAIVGDPVSVVDLVLWRYATFGPSYVDDFCQVAVGASWLVAPERWAACPQ